MGVYQLSCFVFKSWGTHNESEASCLGRDLALGLVSGGRALCVGVADGLQFPWTHPFPSVALRLGVEAQAVLYMSQRKLCGISLGISWATWCLKHSLESTGSFFAS